MATTFTFCDTGQSVSDAAAILSRSEHLVLDCEGRNIGRLGGAVSLLCIGTACAEHIFVFDVLRLPHTMPAMRPLLSILGNKDIRKLVWDGRQDYLELWDVYGVALEGVLDLQLAEVVSRATVRGEGEMERSQQVSFYVRGTSGQTSQGLHMVLGMQKCLERNRVATGTVKDPEVVAMHKTHDSAFWMERPLSQKLLQYAANDIRLIALLYQDFMARGWLAARGLPSLLEQSSRYIYTQKEQGRVGDENAFRAGPIVPLDVLTAPHGVLENCSGCRRELSLQCFEVKVGKGAQNLRRARCRLCQLMATKRRVPRENKWLPIRGTDLLS